MKDPFGAIWAVFHVINSDNSEHSTLNSDFSFKSLKFLHGTISSCPLSPSFKFKFSILKSIENISFNLSNRHCSEGYSCSEFETNQNWMVYGEVVQSWKFWLVTVAMLCCLCANKCILTTIRNYIFLFCESDHPIWLQMPLI